jgi:hypothetical protein
MIFRLRRAHVPEMWVRFSDMHMRQNRNETMFGEPAFAEHYLASGRRLDGAAELALGNGLEQDR